MLKLYYYLVNYELQFLANIFKTVDSMQKLTSKSASATPENQETKAKKRDEQKFVA